MHHQLRSSGTTKSCKGEKEHYASIIYMYIRGYAETPWIHTHTRGIYTLDFSGSRSVGRSVCLSVRLSRWCASRKVRRATRPAFSRETRARIGARFDYNRELIDSRPMRSHRREWHRGLTRRLGGGYGVGWG